MARPIIVHNLPGIYFPSSAKPVEVIESFVVISIFSLFKPDFQTMLFVKYPAKRNTIEMIRNK